MKDQIKYIDWLKDLSEKTVSTEEDSLNMKNLLRLTSYPKVEVVAGIVYLEGRGSPISIHTLAKKLVDMANKQEVK